MPFHWDGIDIFGPLRAAMPPLRCLWHQCGEVEDVVGALTPVVGGVAQVFHELLVELRLLLVAEVEEGEEEDRQQEGWEVESGVQGEKVPHMDACGHE